MTDKKAAWQGGSKQNQIISSYRNNNARQGKVARPASGYIGEIIAGQHEGNRFICGLAENSCLPDAPLMRLQELTASPARMRGCSKALQKRLEREKP